MAIWSIIPPIFGLITAFVTTLLTPSVAMGADFKCKSALNYELLREMVRLREVPAQTHRRFDDLGLLLTEGGLCGSVCAVKISRAVFRNLKLTPLHGDGAEEVAALVGRSNRLLEMDARQGIKFSELKYVMEDVFREAGIDDRVSISLKNTDFGDIGSADIIPQEGENSTSLIAVRSHSPGGSSKNSHAMIAVAANPRSNRVMLLDPNFPDAGVYATLLPTTYAALPGLSRAALELRFDNPGYHTGSRRILIEQVLKFQVSPKPVQ